MKKSLLILVLFAASAPTACGAKTSKSSVPPQEPVYEYGIGADDILQVDVWKRPELSKEVTVRPDGFISLPLVGDIRATGMVARDLAQVLQGKFKTFVADPEVTVIVKASNSYKIYVLGKVRTAGMFVVKTPVSVVQAVAMAGGFTPFASPNDIVVLRRTSGAEKRFHVDYSEVVRGKQANQNIVLQPGDTVVVP
jgi:polysaccharide biosynthesis/export protein